MSHHHLSSYPSSPVGGESDRAMPSPGSPRALDDDDDSTAPFRPLPRPPSHNLGAAATRSPLRPSTPPPHESNASLAAVSAGSGSPSAPALSSWSTPVMSYPVLPSFVPRLQDQSAAQVVDRLRWWRVARVKERPLPVEHFVLGGHYENYSSFGTRPLSRRLARSLRQAAAVLEADRTRTATNAAAAASLPAVGSSVSISASSTTHTAATSATPTRAVSSSSLARTRSPSPGLPTATAASAADGKETERPHPLAITPEDRDLASHKKGSSSSHHHHAHGQQRPGRAAVGTRCRLEEAESARKELIKKATTLLTLFKPRAASAPPHSRVVRHIPKTLSEAAANTRVLVEGSRSDNASPTPSLLATTDASLSSDPLSRRLMAVAGSPNQHHMPLVQFSTAPSKVAAALGSPNGFGFPVFTNNGLESSDPPGFALACENTTAAPRAVVLHNPPRLVLYSRHMAPDRAILTARVTPQDAEGSELMTGRPEIFCLSNLPLYPYEKDFYGRQLRDISLARAAPPPLPPHLQQESASTTPGMLGTSPDRATPAMGSPVEEEEGSRKDACPSPAGGPRRRSRRLRAASVPALPSTEDIHHMLHRKPTPRQPIEGKSSTTTTTTTAVVSTLTPAAATKRYPLSATTSANIMKRVDDLQEVYCFNPFTDCIGTGAFSKVYAALPILRGSEDDDLFTSGATADTTTPAATVGHGEAAGDSGLAGENSTATGAGTSVTTNSSGSNSGGGEQQRAASMKGEEKAPHKVHVVAIKVIARKPGNKEDPLKATRTASTPTVPGGNTDKAGRGAGDSGNTAATAAAAAVAPDCSQRRELIEIEREISILRRLRHTGCSCFYEAVRTPDAFVISMKMHRGSMDVRQYLARFGPPSEARAALMLYQLLETINCLHNEFGLLHRDIKLENLLVSLVDVAQDRVQQLLGPDVNKSDRHSNLGGSSGVGASDGGADDDRHHHHHHLYESRTRSRPSTSTSTTAGGGVGEGLEEKGNRDGDGTSRRGSAAQHQKKDDIATAECRSLGSAPVDTAVQMLRMTLIDFGLARRTRNTISAADKTCGSCTKQHKCAPPQRNTGGTGSPSTPLMGGSSLNLSGGGAGAGRRGFGSRPMPSVASRAGMPSPMPSTANMLLKYYDVEDEDMDEDEGGDDEDSEIGNEEEEAPIESDSSEFSSDEDSDDDDSDGSSTAGDTVPLLVVEPEGKACGCHNRSDSAENSLLSPSAQQQQQQQQQRQRPPQPQTQRKHTFTRSYANSSSSGVLDALPTQHQHQQRTRFPPVLSAQHIDDQQQQQQSAFSTRSLGSSANATPPHVGFSSTFGAASTGTASLGSATGGGGGGGGKPSTTLLHATATSRSPGGSGGGGHQHLQRAARRDENDANTTLLLTPCGTERYLPPEMLEWIVTHGWTRRPTTAALAKQMDMYAIGTVAYVILSGCFPFNATSRATLVQQQRRGPRCNSERWEGVSGAAVGFVQALLDPNPEKRMTAREALKHPFLSEAATIAGKLGLVPHTYGEQTGSAASAVPVARATSAVKSPDVRASSLGRPPLSTQPPQSSSLSSSTRTPTRVALHNSSPPALRTPAAAADHDDSPHPHSHPHGAAAAPPPPPSLSNSIDAYQQAFLEVMSGADDGETGRHPLHPRRQQQQQQQQSPPEIEEGVVVATQASAAPAAAVEDERVAEVLSVHRDSSTTTEGGVHDSASAEKGPSASEDRVVATAQDSSDGQPEPARQRPPPLALAADASAPVTEVARPKHSTGDDLFDQLYNDIMFD